MKIAILTGSFYPHLSPRSFRATELALGLAKLGHQIDVYALIGDYDYSTFEKNGGIHVHSIGKSRLGNEDCSNNGVPKGGVRLFFHRVMRKLFYSLIDYPRFEYALLSYNTLKKIDYSDLLITIAHPYGIHWGTSFFKSKYKNTKFKKWVSDCGDPFMGDKDVKRFQLFLKPLEKMWCKQTDYIAVPVEEGKKGYYPEFVDKIRVIPQSIDFSTITIDEYHKNDRPTFLYCGAVYKGMRDPTEFLNFLCNVPDDFRFIVYSQSDLFKTYSDRLKEKMEIRPPLNRKALIKVQSQMDFLINITNDSDNQVPSKLIDYSLAKRPILNISTSFSQQEKDSFMDFIKGDYSKQYVVKDIDKYDSLNVAKQFVSLYFK